METIAELVKRNARPGRIEWIGTRPARRAGLVPHQSVEITGKGLTGDHYQSGGKRTVSLIQHEHLSVIAALIGRDCIEPEALRRNLVISGINLLGLRNRRFSAGGVTLEGTGLCAPCSRMEETLGHGGYAAVRGHGGIVARVVQPGHVSLGDPVVAVDIE